MIAGKAAGLFPTFPEVLSHAQRAKIPDLVDCLMGGSDFSILGIIG
jgi:hypothetical protein